MNEEVPIRSHQQQDMLEQNRYAGFGWKHPRNEHAEQPPKTRRAGDTNDPRSARVATGNGGRLQELVDVVRNIEGRLSAVENRGRPHPTEAMALPTWI